jgi:hypothetical protein
LNDPFNQGKVKQFDKVSEFRFHQDDYGKWKAKTTKAPNNRINADRQFRCASLPAGYVERQQN